jgi:nucleotide-binding universal stress UspA family protein
MRLDKVMVAVKGDPTEEAAIRLACDVAEPAKGTVYVLHVIEVGRDQPVDVEDREATSRGEEVLQRAERLVRGQNLHVEAALLQARDVGPAVVREAIDKRVEIIILALSYKRRYGVFSLGSAVPYILNHAPCRVVVLREPVLAPVR